MSEDRASPPTVFLLDSPEPSVERGLADVAQRNDICDIETDSLPPPSGRCGRIVSLEPSNSNQDELRTAIYSPVTPTGARRLVEEVLRGASAMLVELGGSTVPTGIDLSACRIHLGGLIWITIRYLHNQGHVGVEVGDLARIRAKAPELRDKP